jgi:peroxiredoxin
LSDPDLAVTKRYGAVRDDLGVDVANRYYFLIDKEGTLIWKDVTGRLIPVDELLRLMSGVD